MGKISRARELLPIEELYEEHLLAKNNIKQPRDTDGAFHPSQLGGCTRKLWYAAIMMPPKHRIDAKLRCVFDHGHAVHDWQQAELEKLLVALSWQHPTHTFYSKFEVSLRDPDLGNQVASRLNLEGRADGVIFIAKDDEENSANGSLTIVYELKTMADASWQKLTKPQAKHVAQATTYAECFDADVILFQYYNKNSDVSKFFYVEPDPVAWRNVHTQIETVRNALDTGTEVEAEYSMWECKSCGYYYDCRPELRQQGDIPPFMKG